MELLAVVEFCPRRHYLVQLDAAQGTELPRTDHLDFRISFRAVSCGPQDRSGYRRAGLCFADGRGAVLRWRAIDFARYHRRIPRAHVQRSQRAAALSGARPVGLQGPSRSLMEAELYQWMGEDEGSV